MGLIDCTSVLGTCDDVLLCLKADISDLQGGAKRTPTYILKQVVIIVSLLIAAALTASCKFNFFPCRRY